MINNIPHSAASIVATPRRGDRSFRLRAGFKKFPPLAVLKPAPRDDLGNFLRDGILTCPVILQLQPVDHFLRVLACGIHGHSPGCHFAGEAFPDAGTQDTAHIGRHRGVQDGLLIRLEYRIPAFRLFCLFQGRGFPAVRTFLPGSPGTARRPVSLPPWQETVRRK